MTDFDDHFRKLLSEQVGFGFGGEGQMPVQQVEFPTGIQQVDPNRAIITQGETTEAGEGREDYAMEIQSELDPTIEEVGNLMITIGHILAQSRLVSDKYNVAEILDFLNHNFQAPEYPTEENPEQLDMPCVGDEPPMPPPEDGMSQPEPQTMSPGYAYLQEKKRYYGDDVKMLVEKNNS